MSMTRASTLRSRNSASKARRDFRQLGCLETNVKPLSNSIEMLGDRTSNLFVTRLEQINDACQAKESIWLTKMTD